MITIQTTGSFDGTEKYLKKAASGDIFAALDRFGAAGVVALSRATPKDSGETASSWSYEIKKGPNAYTIAWKNSHVNNGVPIAIILQYGHGTGTGGYVHGRDYINPAMRPIFDQMAAEAWKAVTS